MATTALPNSVHAQPVVAALQPLRKRLVAAAVAPFEVELEDGSRHRLVGGAYEGTNQEPTFRLTMRHALGLSALTNLDEVQVALAYLDGHLDVNGDFMSCLDLRAILTDRHPIQSLRRFLQPLVLGHGRTNSTWIRSHYDRGNPFYFAFLDPTYRLYSQALYLREDESLEQAVQNKLAWIVEVCRLSAGSHMLDIGAGWGALERYAGSRGVNSTMLTLSQEQYDHLKSLRDTHEMPCRLRVYQQSLYEFEMAEQYEAIVMLGVMEHLPDYGRVFARLSRLTAPGGRVYMDFVANRRKFSVSTFTQRFIFEGNHTPVHLPGLFEAANRWGFECIALHNDRHSYYLTLRSWAQNLESACDELIAMVGERVYRLYRLYLWAGARQLHRDGGLESYRVVFQKSIGRPSSEIGCYRRA